MSKVPQMQVCRPTPPADPEPMTGATAAAVVAALQELNSGRPDRARLAMAEVSREDQAAVIWTLEELLDMALQVRQTRDDRHAKAPS